MNLLAFLFHTVLEFTDEKYLKLREIAGARKRFFEQIRTLLIFKLFDSFRHFMEFMAEALLEPDSTKVHTTSL